MVRQRPVIGFVTTDCTVGGCYKGRVSGTTRVATTHLGSAAASSDPIPWSIDRMAWQGHRVSFPTRGFRVSARLFGTNNYGSQTDTHTDRQTSCADTSVAYYVRPDPELKVRLWRDYTCKAGRNWFLVSRPERNYLDPLAKKRPVFRLFWKNAGKVAYVRGSKIFFPQKNWAKKKRRPTLFT